MPDRSPDAPDLGEVPADVSAALTAYAAEPTRHGQVVEALADARLILPIVSVPADAAAAQGLSEDHCAELAAVLLQRPDGRRGLLAFTGVDALARWDPSARPMPVPTREAARAARHEGADAIVVDVAGPNRFVIDGPDLVGLAAGWVLARVGADTAWIRPAPGGSATLAP